MWLPGLTCALLPGAEQAAGRYNPEEEALADEMAAKIVSGQPFTERKSTFQVQGAWKATCKQEGGVPLAVTARLCAGGGLEVQYKGRSQAGYTAVMYLCCSCTLSPSSLPPPSGKVAGAKTLLHVVCVKCAGSRG